MIRKYGRPALRLLGVAWVVFVIFDWSSRHLGLLGLLGSLAAIATLFGPLSFVTPPATAKPQLRTLPRGALYPVGVVLFVTLLLAVPLLREFWEPAQPVWDGFLALFLTAMVTGSFLGVRYLQSNHVEFGDARIREAEPGAASGEISALSP